MDRLSGRSESPGPVTTVETMTEEMCRARALSVPCLTFNTSGFSLDGRDVSSAPSDSELFTPASSPPPLNPAYEHHAQASEDLSPDPHVSVPDIQEAFAASELAANLNMALGSSRSLDGDHGDEEVHPVATASDKDDDLDFIFNIFTTAVQEYNKYTAILKQYEETVNAIQASTDSMKVSARLAVEKVAEVVDASTLTEWERGLNAFQAEIDMCKASMREAEGFTNAFMDRWTKFAAEGSIE